MAETAFDLVIIGGGPAGYVAAIRAAQLGLKTAVVEKRKELGGTCLNVGCIPSKALLNSSHHFHFATSEAATHGIQFSGVQLDLAKMMARKDQVVKMLTGGIGVLFKRNGITRFEGHGKLVAPGKVDVDGGETLTAPHVILATGSVSTALPHLPVDGGVVVTSTEALYFDKVPETLVVIGAGAIGLELGSVWARLGSKVTIIEFLPRIAPGFDLEIAGALQKSLAKQGIEFHLETKVTALERTESGARVAAAKGTEPLVFEASRVLVAVGRKPFLDNCVAPEVGLKLDERGRVSVDDHYRTNVGGVYAIGDVIDGPMLAHKSEEEGIACVEMIAGKAGHVNYEVIPGVIYTNPEAASVGITEEQAKEQGLKVKIGKFPFRANGRALANGDSDGFVKLIADAESDRLLGGHVLSSTASELIAEIVSVMEFHGSSEDLARTVHAHPTLSEAVKEGALAVDGRAIHMA